MKLLNCKRRIEIRKNNVFLKDHSSPSSLSHRSSLIYNVNHVQFVMLECTLCSCIEYSSGVCARWIKIIRRVDPVLKLSERSVRDVRDRLPDVFVQAHTGKDRHEFLINLG